MRPETAALIEEGGSRKGGCLCHGPDRGDHGCKEDRGADPHVSSARTHRNRDSVFVRCGGGRVAIEAKVTTVGRTGVEMEAMTAVGAAAL